MVSQSDLKNCYNDIYRVLRDYIWSYPVIDALADLEISVYQACPDIVAVRTNFYRLDQLVRDVKFDDDEFKKAFDRFSDCMNEDDVVYTKLDRVNEVTQL